MLDDALPKGEFDFVDDIAAPIPIRVLGHILGVPEEHHDRLIELSDRLINNNDPELASVTADSPESDAYRLAPFRSPDAQEIIELGHGLFDARRRAAAGRRDVAARARRDPTAARTRSASSTRTS